MTRALDRMLWPSLWAATLLFVAWGVLPRAAVFTTVLPPERLIALAAVVKLSLLVLASVWGVRSRARLDADNPVRPAWTLLTAGMVCNALGQAALARYQLTGEESPFPSVGDVFYLLAYPLIGAALLRFVRAYHEAGYPMGSRTERLAVLAVAAAACGALSIVVVRPVAASDLPALQKWLSAAYPLLDMALLVPLALLLRTTWHFRGGSVGTAWTIVLSGIVFMCAGDVLFAYFTALGRTGLDPFIHAAYIVSYGLIAAGVRRHLALIA
jgi:diguanylate cyclase